jgi:hypothetical protein
MIYFLMLMVIIPVVLCWIYILAQHKEPVKDSYGHSRNAGEFVLQKNYSLLMYWIVGLWFAVSTIFGFAPALFPGLQLEYEATNFVALSTTATLGCFILWCFLKETPYSFIRIFQTPSAELRAEITKEVAEQLENQLVTEAVQKKIEEIAQTEYAKRVQEEAAAELEKDKEPKVKISQLDSFSEFK